MTPTAIARALGRRGGLARARRLSADQKQAIAAMGAHARMESRRIARRIEANFRYAEAARLLRGVQAVKRESRFRGELPDLGRTRR